LRKGAGDVKTDAFGGAGDESGFSIKSLHDNLLPQLNCWNKCSV
jgi:hypothetical protein